MLRQLVYKGKRRFLVMHPIDLLVEHGKEVTVNNKEEADLLKELGFEEVAQGKEEVKKDKKESEE